MAKAKSSGKKKKKLHHRVKKQLGKEVKLSVGLVIILLLLVIVRLPYNAKEVYTEIEEYTVDVVVPDYDNPVEKRICTPVPADVRLEPDPFSPFVKTSGKDFICYAKLRVWNDGDQEGDWTYRYTFELGSKNIVKEVTKTVPPSSSIWFEFEADECQEGDTVTGHYELVSGPIRQDCTYETQYPDKTVTEKKQREVQKERYVTKYEPLWQKLIGYNKHEKV